MKTKFTLKNFRVFDANEGGTFNLSPITILTGCNSSGKSSLVKALLLLKNFFIELQTRDVRECKLDFSNQSAKLGRFDLVRNKDSRKDSKMYFSYTVCPSKLKEELLVELWFSNSNNDRLNNGWLDRFAIKLASSKKVIIDASYQRTGDVGVVLSIKKIDLSLILKNHFKRVYRDLLREESSLCAANDGHGFEDYVKRINKYLKGLGKYVQAAELENEVERVKQRMSYYADPYFSEYSGLVYTASAEQGVVLPLPILSKLKNVKKQYVRDTILTIIGDKSFHYKQLLADVITAFEASRYDDFVSYYRSKEKEGFVFANLIYKFGFKDDIRVMNVSNAKEYIITDKINAFSSYLKLSRYSLPVNAMDGASYHSGSIDASSFNAIFGVMSEISALIDEKEYEKFAPEYAVTDFNYYEEHKVFTDVCKLFDCIIAEVLSPQNFRSFMYVGDADIEIKRIYAIENKDEMSKLLSKYFEACNNSPSNRLRAGDFINKWVKSFGIGEKVSIEMSSDGYGVMLRLFKDEKDKNGNILVDEGFGITKLVATLINIEYAILTGASNIAIEEPENHLHPKYQSLLAEMFVDAYKNYAIHFIVETHSEYLIRKLQTLVAQKELSTDTVSLQYVYDAKSENRPKGEPHVKNIPIRPDGTLQDAFGPGFFDEADNLAMDLLTIKAMS